MTLLQEKSSRTNGSSANSANRWTQKWHNTSTQKHHSFHSGAGACVSDQKAGERGGFCGCWCHAELPVDRSVEEASGSHYSWRPWRERERDNWWVMCMSESKCEDDCRARERALVHTPVRWAVWVCPDPPAAIPACYCRRSELWAADGTDERGVWTTGSDCREKTRTKRIRNRRLQWLDLRKYESGTFTWITWKGQCSY